MYTQSNSVIYQVLTANDNKVLQDTEMWYN